MPILARRNNWKVAISTVGLVAASLQPPAISLPTHENVADGTPDPMSMINTSIAVCEKDPANIILAPYRRLDQACSVPLGALKEINKALQKEPSNLSLQKFRWHLAHRTGQTIAVLTAQQNDYGNCHNLPLGEFHLWCLCESQHMRKARELSNRLVKDHPRDARAHYLRAIFSYQAGDLNTAQKEIDELLHTHPSPDVVGWKALLLGYTGQRKKAEQMFANSESKYGKNVGSLARFEFQRNSELPPEIVEENCRRLLAIKPATAAERTDRYLFLSHLLTVSSWDLLGQEALEVAKLDPVPEWYEPKATALPFFSPETAADRNRWHHTLQKLKERYPTWFTYICLALLMHPTNKNQAIKLLHQSIEENPEQSSAYFVLASLENSTQKKIELLDLGLRADPLQPWLLNERAELRIKQKDYPKALADWRQAYQANPNRRVQFLRQICFAQIELHHQAAAIAEIVTACQKHADDPDLLDLKVTVLLKGGKVSDALTSARNSVALLPNEPQTWLTLGRLLEAKDPNQAILLYSDGIKNTADPALILQRGNLFWMLKQYEKAIIDANCVLASYPDNTNALNLRASSYQLTGKTSEALADYSHLSKLAPDNACWVNSQMVLFTAEDYDLAKSIFAKQTARKSQSYPQLCFWYAKYLQRVHHEREAVECITALVSQSGSFRHQLESQKNWSSDLENLLQLREALYEKLGHKLEELDELHRICGIYPHNVEYWKRYVIAVSKVNPENAHAVLKRAIALNPHSLDLLMVRVELLQEANNLHYLAALTQVLQRDPKNEKALGLRIEYCRTHNLFAQYVQDARTLLSIHPDAVLFANKLINALMKNGQKQEALAEAIHSIKKHPHEASFWETKLCILYAMGRVADVREELKTLSKKGIEISFSRIKLRCFSAGYIRDDLASIVRSADEHCRQPLATEKKLIGSATDKNHAQERVALLKRLAELSAAEGEYQKTIAYCNKALSLAPSDHRLYLNRAAAYAGLQQPDKAAADRKQALELFAKSREKSR